MKSVWIFTMQPNISQKILIERGLPIGMLIEGILTAKGV
jgi:hypothetical protein